MAIIVPQLSLPVLVLEKKSNKLTVGAFEGNDNGKASLFSFLPRTRIIAIAVLT